MTTNEMKIEKLEPEEEQKLEEVRKVFREYADSLGIDLSFQQFEEELKNLPGDYSAPEGCIILAKVQRKFTNWVKRKEEKVVGCVALRKIDEDCCEMKRLYVRPKYRNKGIGRRLAEKVIEEAQKKGYRKMKLDTIPSLKKANKLYKSLGFKECEPYVHNPLEDAIFMELELKNQKTENKEQATGN